MGFFKRRYFKRAKLALVTVLAMVLLITLFPASVSAQFPTYDPNAVRSAVLNMGMDSLSKVILTDPGFLGTYVNLSAVAPVASTATVPNTTAPPTSLVNYATAHGLTVQRAALLILGKALFWDEQVGSDGQACASCHFQAGVDPRSVNVLNPGSRNIYPSEQTQFNPVASDPTGTAPGLNYQMKTNDFPFFQLTDMTQTNYNDRQITFDTNDIVGSQGTYHATYAGSPAPNYSLPFAQGTYDTAAPRVLDSVFNINGVNVRSVGPRQAAPTVNAVFNFSNFWDGRADNTFNAVNPFGAKDITSTILRNGGSSFTADFALVTNSSLASQTTGPPNSTFSDEMAFAGRHMPDLGRKLLRLTGPGKGATATATIDTVTGSATLGQVLSIAVTAGGTEYQNGATLTLNGGGGSGATATATVDPTTGAVTGITVTAPGAGYVTPPIVTIISNGLASATNPTVTPIIPLGAQIVSPTDSVLGTFVNTNGQGINLTYTELIQWAFVSAFWDSAGPPDPVTTLPTALVATDGCQLMEENFTMFWGLAIQAYETTLRADQTPFDKFMAGDNTALNQEELRGLLTYIHTESFTQQPDPQFNNLGTGACQLCHSGPELTEVSLANVPLKGIVTTDMTVTIDHNRELAIIPSSSNFNVGFTNISVRPYWEDLAIGGTNSGTFSTFPGIINTDPLSNFRAFLAGLAYGVPALAPAAPNPSRGTNIDGAFKIPSIRNIDLTAPYYHNGSMLTLMQTAQFYARHGNFVDVNEGNTDVGQDMVFTNDADNQALVAFMLTFTDERVRWEQAPFDHPQLFVPNGANTAVANPVLGSGYASDNYITLPAVGAAGRQALGLPALSNYLGVTNYPGEVLFITVNSGGSGYSTAPTVTISAPPAGGKQATAVAIVSGGAVTDVIVTNPGAGYTTPPTVSFSSGTATATSSIVPGEITFISVNNGGSYTTAPTVTISAPPTGGTQATAQAVLVAGSGARAIGIIRITNPGSGYDTPPTVSFSSGAAAATATVLSPNGVTHFTP
jgi:cytochrome c peroxidase